jgi:hypothetical protein
MLRRRKLKVEWLGHVAVTRQSFGASELLARRVLKMLALVIARGRTMPLVPVHHLRMWYRVCEQWRASLIMSKRIKNLL